MHAAWRAVALTLLGVFLRTSIEPNPNHPGVTPVTNFTFEDVLTQMGLGYFFLFLLVGPLATNACLRVAMTILRRVLGAVLLLSAAAVRLRHRRTVGVPADWEYNLLGVQAHWNKNTNPAADFDRWFLNLFPRLDAI